MNDAIRMQISAFVDGELPDNEADLLLRRMGQDGELRHSVAEYLAIGRVMRSEPSWPGADRIHERVAAAIDDRSVAPRTEVVADAPARRFRPFASIAAAAVVAGVALFALQQFDGSDRGASEVASVAGGQPAADAGYTVPRPLDEQVLRYYRIHGATAPENGAGGMITRLVSLRLDEEALPPVTGTDGEMLQDDPLPRRSR